MRKRTFMAAALLGLVTSACASGTTTENEDSATSSISSPTTLQAPTTTVAVTTTPPPPSTTTTPTPTTPLGDVVGVIAADGGGWEVAPGRYVGEFDGWNVSLDVTEPIKYLEGEGRLDFATLQAEGPEWLRLGTFVGVIPPKQAGIHAPHDPVVPAYTADLPGDLGSYLATVPQLVIEEVAPAQGDGFIARAWDVSVDPSRGDTFSCFLGSCVSILVSDFGGVYVFGSDSAARVWEFDGVADGIYGYLQSGPGNFADNVAMAEMLIRNSSFRPALGADTSNVVIGAAPGFLVGLTNQGM